MICYLGNNKSSTRTPASSTPTTTATGANNQIQLSDLHSYLSEIATPSQAEPAVQVISHFFIFYSSYLLVN